MYWDVLLKCTRMHHWNFLERTVQTYNWNVLKCTIEMYNWDGNEHGYGHGYGLLTCTIKTYTWDVPLTCTTMYYRNVLSKCTIEMYY